MKLIENALRELVGLRRALAFLFHSLGIVVSYWLAYELRFDFTVPPEGVQDFQSTVGYAILAFLLMIVLFRLYQGLWRFFTFRDCIDTAAAIAAGTVFLGLLILWRNNGTFENYPRSILIINSILLLAWEVGGRGMVRLLREHFRQRDRLHSGQNTPGEMIEERVIVVGEIESVEPVVRAMKESTAASGVPVGVISPGIHPIGTRLHGLRIFGDETNLVQAVKKEMATTLVLVPPYDGPRQLQRVMDQIREAKLSVEFRVVPSFGDITSGKVDVNRIRKVAIQDLLHRSTANLDREPMRKAVEGRRIVVTGAGGSIGSEICRQVVALRAKSLTLFEISEFLLFEIEQELRPVAEAAGVELIPVTGDVRRPDHLRSALQQTEGADVLYHAAAYKHVHLMEKNVAACFQNNVIGTHIAATVAEEFAVEEFVLVSTDKAVRPTSLMGASKRLAERIVIERGKSSTAFKAVRFGNVLGSSGSVIPIFERQIAAGGPVTVTSSEVTRYFMTIPEAVELVLSAGAISDDRKICVLEMGEPVKIDSLARRMIELSGFTPDVDIQVTYTGLRPGEKEYEELLTDDENVIKTDYERIWVVGKNEDALHNDRVEVGELLELIDSANPGDIRKFAHEHISGSLLL